MDSSRDGRAEGAVLQVTLEDGKSLAYAKSEVGSVPDARAAAMELLRVPTPEGESLYEVGGGGDYDEACRELNLAIFEPLKYTVCQDFLQEGLTSGYRHTRLSGKKSRRRVVLKNGDCNVSRSNVAKRRRRYLQDIFTTLVDIQWRWTLLVFAMSFMMSWLGFAVVWWTICYIHGDFLPEHLPTKQEESGWTPCVFNIFTFASCFLFSIETQHTIGYGSRHTTEECPEAILVMCLQSICGVMIQAFMVGIVFAKLSRPKKRTQTLMFSRNACICQRDGQLCLLFRVGDMRKSHIIEAHIRAQLIRKKITMEGEVLPFFQYELDVGYDVGEDRIFFIWPMTIVHKINENSPLYEMSAHDLAREKFEIVVMLEGVIESTGMTTQARSSYLPNEILWGYRFEPLVFFKKDTNEFTVDYSLFNNTVQVATPLCSARHLEQFKSRASTPVTPPTPATPLSPLTPVTPSESGVAEESPKHALDSSKRGSSTSLAKTYQPKTTVPCSLSGKNPDTKEKEGSPQLSQKVNLPPHRDSLPLQTCLASSCQLNPASNV